MSHLLKLVFVVGDGGNSDAGELDTVVVCPLRDLRTLRLLQCHLLSMS